MQFRLLEAIAKMPDDFDWLKIHGYILELEKEGRVTRTFRRLDTERQQAILDAVLDEAIAKGPTAINIKQVAERANVSVGALYTYFNNREGLLDFAITVCSRIVIEALESIRPYLGEVSLREMLPLYIQGGVEMTKTHMGLLQFFARAAYHGETELNERVVRPIATLMLSLVQDMLTQAIRRGEIRPDIDIDATARAIHALTIAYGDSQIFPYLNTYFQISNDQVTPERALAGMVELILNGIGLPPKESNPHENV